MLPCLPGAAGLAGFDGFDGLLPGLVAGLPGPGLNLFALREMRHASATVCRCVS